jgi:CheY-like chemotaxis protein
MENPRRPPAKSRGLRPAPQPARRRALIVDDEPDFVELVALWFRSEGWTTEVAGDGVKALELLADRNIDLLIADLQMPGMNGWELLRHLRGRWGSDLTLPHWPGRIVVVSGRVEHEVDCFARHLGADAFLPKPIDRLTLFNTVAALFAPTPEPQHTPATHRGQA